MSLIEKYIKGIRFLLPSPFSIAVLLTLFTFILAFSWPNNIYVEDLNGLDKFTHILISWNDGLWNVQGMAFAVQMMLMLLLGHVLALSNLSMLLLIIFFHFVVIMLKVHLLLLFSP